MRIAGLGTGFRTGATTPIAHVTEVLGRVDALAGGPWANLVVARDDARALADAARSSDELRAGYDRGPLHGVAVAVKGNVDVAGLVTGGGSDAYADAPPATVDADIVARLRAAGAVVVATAHLHELAYGPTGEINPGGPARNPHDPSLITGGSSSGPAALVALGVVPLAVGTDTGCSVRTPASLCGVVGLMPALGVLPTTGVMPLSTTLDHVGLLAADVDDVAAAWSAVAGESPAVPAPPRVAVLSSPPFAVHDPGIEAAVASAAQRLRAGGATVSDLGPGTPGWPVIRRGLTILAEAYPVVVGVEAASAHRRVLAERPERLAPATRERLVAQLERSPADYRAALVAMRAARGEVLAALGRLGVDVLLLAATPVRAVPLGTARVGSGRAAEPLSAALLRHGVPFSALGTPAISVPAPAVDGLPLGVQLVGVAGDTTALTVTAGRLGV